MFTYCLLLHRALRGWGAPCASLLMESALFPEWGDLSRSRLLAAYLPAVPVWSLKGRRGISFFFFFLIHRGQECDKLVLLLYVRVWWQVQSWPWSDLLGCVKIAGLWRGCENRIRPRGFWIRLSFLKAKAVFPRKILQYSSNSSVLSNAWGIARLLWH